MALAIFDLDNTLLAGDSDYLWGQFLVQKGLVAAAEYEAANDQFYQDYLNGTLDIYAFLAFSLAPLARLAPERLEELRREFISTSIEPLILPAARELVARHKQRGDILLIITATNRFVTAPIARLLGIDNLLASEPEQLDGRYTGKVVGTPTYREGKVTVLNQWLQEHGHDLEGSWFYSDSHNDIPLLERVTHPIVVDADDTLRAHAEERGWTIISLRQQ